jgi:hypothetical protein
MATLLILGGRKEKIRPGDVLGALTGEAGYSKEQIGKIKVTETSTYVAVARGIGQRRPAQAVGRHGQGQEGEGASAVGPGG